MATVERAGEGRLHLAAPGGPERFFRVARPTAAGEVVSSSMPAGPWLTGPSGRPLAGALGVLIDNVAGWVLVRRRPPGGWSVSAEITLDLLLPVPADGSVLLAEGSVRHADTAGGFSTASVTDGSGRLLAVCTQHGRWVRGAPAAHDGTALASGVPPGTDLAGFLGGRARAAEGGALLELTVTPELANPLGNLHGGITLCACDLVAQAAIDAAGGPLPTASIHVAYPRPIPVGTTVRFTAQVAHLGRAFGIVRVTALRDSGKPGAIATVTTGPPHGPPDERKEPPMKALDTRYQTLDLEAPAPGVVVVTLNRPDRYNAMTAAMFDELERAAIALDDEDGLRAVIITGAGKAFCAGYDLADAEELPSLGALGVLDLQERAARALLAVRSARVPVIAAVNGAAAGGGLSLALAADIRLAAPAARFNAAFVRIGLSAGDLGASWLLTRLIGPGAASDICFTGRLVEAAEALALGLVNSVSEPGALLDDALALAASIAANSPGGVQLSKRALQANLEAASYAAAIELENRGQALLTRGADFPEALAAFKDKRPPVFTGR